MIWVQAAVACAISYLSLFAVRPLLAKLHVVDVPNARSSHQVATLRGAGVGPLLGMVGAYVLLLATGDQDSDRRILCLILVLSFSAAVLGIFEDVIGIGVAIRAGAQLLIGVVMASALVVAIGANAGWILAGALIIAGYINVANFMDGINGISGFHAIVVGSAYALGGAIAGEPWMVASGSILAAAFAGFLPWNLIRRRVFLGDVGSYLLGGSIAGIAFGAIISGVNALFVVGPVLIYLADAGWTLWARIRAGHRWYEAHRSHVYQRLNDAGLGHLSSALVVAAFSVFSSATGFIGLVGGWLGCLICLVILAGIASAYLTVPGWAFRTSQSTSEPERRRST
jgi:UDP-N-acetylmuramyl pentapeptide phosphotransferase/UDP-N-acetylglucosamine-1-phosphate transferase